MNPRILFSAALVSAVFLHPAGVFASPDDGGVFQTIDFPGASGTQAGGINSGDFPCSVVTCWRRATGR